MESESASDSDVKEDSGADTDADTDTDTDSDSDADSDTDSDTGSDTETGDDSDSGTDSESDPRFQGCRSPKEQGCAVCCENLNQPDCLPFVENPNVQGEYVPSNQTCPELCLPCAACTEAEEISFLEVENEIEAASCDCENIEIGIDPCFAPFGCGCLCGQYNSKVDECGPMDRDL
jgi:hypothetical protein